MAQSVHAMTRFPGAHGQTRSFHATPFDTTAGTAALSAGYGRVRATPAHPGPGPRRRRWRGYGWRAALHVRSRSARIAGYHQCPCAHAGQQLWRLRGLRHRHRCRAPAGLSDRQTLPGLPAAARAAAGAPALMNGPENREPLAVAGLQEAAIPVAPTVRLDRQIHAALARASGSLSLVSGLLAVTDWAAHLAVSPGKRLELLCLALQQANHLLHYISRSSSSDPDSPSMLPVADRRFSNPDWQRWPFNLWHQSFLLAEQWWAAATRDVWGVEKHHADLVAFAARQCLDVFSPSNQLLTNPEVLRITMEQRGANLLMGMQNCMNDMIGLLLEKPASTARTFMPGRDVAVSPGKVVLRNRIMELIRYAPATETVYPEPLLLIPAWIMKYYILDLSPANSLIRYLVEKGHTVFCVSWKNPAPADRDLSMDDYLDSGFHAALDAVNSACPDRKPPWRATGTSGWRR
ncbi:conserved hypothetical protein [Ricinus communis]|uniref:Poly-beta-hydroxybutyrate polymerase N-terminal domain-containing protein n=1 Tax=Ricinus communis TaxID=3988 RepID=B9T9C3_RICCO|nr:conserved hypothetical protein [Ricinus communis]